MRDRELGWSTAVCALVLSAACGNSETAAPTASSPTTTAGASPVTMSGGATAPGGSSAAPPSGASAGTPAAQSGKAGQGSVTPAGATGGAGSSAAGSGGVGPAATAGAPAAGSSAGAAADSSASGPAAGSSPGAAGTPAAGGGAAGSMGATTAWKRGCKHGDVGPCASFIPENGMELELGPLGAVMEANVGKGFEYPVASGDSDDNAQCRNFSALFGEDQKSTDTLLDLGNLDMRLYTLYRPAQIPEGQKLPIITWGNGTCAQPEGYGTLLRYVASHGFFVVAANSRWVGDGSQMKKGIDYAFAANDDKNSPYYQKLDTTKVGAMGHSQGGQGTVAVVSDARVQAVIIWNANPSTSKPFLAVSGDMDITMTSASGMRSAVSSARTKAAFLYYHMVPQTGSFSGHLTLMTQPSRVVEPAVAWWKYVLSGDVASKAFFVGMDCKLCNSKDQYEFGQRGLE